MNPQEYHAIVEADHRILNPITPEQLALLAEICDLVPGQRILDLACGKAELLATWAHSHGVGGVGVDINEAFLAAARARVAELDVADRVELVQADAGTYRPAEAFDVVCCLGATWIGGGLAGTLSLLRAAARPDGRIVVGEPYWTEEPPAEACQALGVEPDLFATLAGTLDRVEEAGLDLVELVVANLDGWDRYEAMRWAAADRWLRDHPDDPGADTVREGTARHRRAYLTYGRRYLGWAVFVLR